MARLPPENSERIDEEDVGDARPDSEDERLLANTERTGGERRVV